MADALLTAVGGFSLAALVGLPPSDQDLPAPTRLTEGQALERDMAAGESHRYDIELQAGQDLQVPVEQCGVDVPQTLTGPRSATTAPARSASVRSRSPSAAPRAAERARLPAAAMDQRAHHGRT